MMRSIFWCLSVLGLIFSCGSQPKKSQPHSRLIVVTYSALGALVKDLASPQFQVKVVIPNGLDPHEWAPSAKDIALFSQADLIVQNGLGLEGSVEKVIVELKARGMPVFTAANCGIVHSLENAHDVADPHLWLDPLGMRKVILDLAFEIKQRFSVSLDQRAGELAYSLQKLDEKIKAQMGALEPQKRLLVTGHESLGYFAKRYELTLVGTIVSQLTTQASVSASELAQLKNLLIQKNIKTLFIESGTHAKIAQTLALELKIRLVEIGTHALAADGSYFTMMENLASILFEALKNQ